MITWEDWRNGNADIFMYDLETAKETQITTNIYNQQNSAVYNDFLVWKDNRNGNYDMYRLITDSKEQTRTALSRILLFGKTQGMATAISMDFSLLHSWMCQISHLHGKLTLLKKSFHLEGGTI